ncbi:MAG: phosphomannomutase/phosphoglucomutase [SAR86 cluster bacterium]|uniref:phosphomannomutase n=1 Tax=SAR86 cluster bacterium TaxID=2030880 RepID=A0A2A4X1I3_9GAMM|nr:MAG: phosphomannomutase/phosphoglucomutase [SAR86 cluster bacterium]
MNQVATQADPESIPASIFRAYDIRGIAEQQLTTASVKRIGQAIGSEALDQNITSLLVGYDGRLSSPTLSIALIEGIQSSGCSVVSIGLVPTPLLYFATYTTDYTSGVMLTASHNPANYNGLKIVFNQTSLADNQIQTIRTRIENDQLRTGRGGFAELEVDRSYIDNICGRVQLSKPLKIVIDCGNAVPGKIAPTLFQELGCDVHPIFCEIDGSFPNHHPDPTVPENLAALASTVLEKNADIGVALDGDGDRVGLITNRGKFVDADRMLMLLVQTILPSYSGRAVVFDVKCSSKLGALVEQFGGSPVMHRSGHSFMKQKMRETNAILGGEYAAHIFIKDDWFGFDDGLYVAARLLKIISESSASSDEIFDQFFTGFCTPEIKIEVPEERKFSLMDRLLELANFPAAKLITLDGLRVEYADGWGLVRASNTSPALLLRFEADSQERMDEIQEKFRTLILSVDKNLEIGF